MAAEVKVCIDTNVLLGFFNEEPGKVESTNLFLQILFKRRIPVVIPTITLLELASILAAADRYTEAERVITAIRNISLISISEFSTDWVLATARLKKINQLAMADAIIVATAVETGCSHLITFDSDFSKVSDITVMNPSEYIRLFPTDTK